MLELYLKHNINHHAFTKEEVNEYKLMIKKTEINIKNKIAHNDETIVETQKDLKKLEDLINTDKFDTEKEKICCILNKKGIIQKLEQLSKQQNDYIKDSNKNIFEMKNKLEYIEQNQILTVSEFIDKYISIQVVENYKRYNNLEYILDTYKKSFTYYTTQSIDILKDIILECFNK